MNAPSREVRAEIARIAEAIDALLSGAMDAGEFRKIRVVQGIYPVRGGTDRYLLRVRIPLGRPSPGDLRALADAADRFTAGRPVHLTTRQDVHLYGISMREIPAALAALEEAGLSTREACGDTVRNVVVCPLAGIAPDEPFDVSPYAGALGAHLLRHPAGQRLPRKFKIAFEGCPGADHVGLGLHDVGVRAVRSAEDRPGFRIFLAGGLGALPRAGILLEPFTPASALVPTVLAALTLFDRLGNRENRGRARLKFVAAAMGEDPFRAAVRAERLLVEESSSSAFALPPEPVAGTAGQLRGEASVAEWPGSFAQQAELAALPVRVPLGDLSPESLRALADLAEENGAQIRLTPGQGLIVANVPRARVGEAANGLRRVGLSPPPGITVARCAGTDTCTVGTTRARGLAELIEREAAAAESRAGGGPPLTVGISGCPNGCGRHLVADIGLAGVSRTVTGVLPASSGRLAPHYALHLGGETRPDGTVRFGTPIGRLPARRVPEAVRRATALVRAQAGPGETAAETIARLGRNPFHEALRDLLEPPAETFSEEDFLDLGPDGPVPFPPARSAPRAP